MVEEVYLLRLQSQLYEYLLQLLVHKVDAELFKSIFLMKRVNYSELSNNTDIH